MLDAREPPKGDFVAYVEKIEREQLARALLPHLSAGGKVVSENMADDRSRRLSTSEAQRLLQALKAKGGITSAQPVGATIGVVIGAALIAFGMMAEGGIFFVILGAALLWHNLRKLRRASSAAPASPAQQVDSVFTPKAPAAPRQRSG